MPEKPKVLLLDNYDSFTYNLFQQMSRLGASVDVELHDATSIEDIERRGYDRIVISPGPGTPAEARMSCRVVEVFGGRIPVLGVCLGHQCLSHVHGVAVTRAPEVRHGKTSPIFHTGRGIFAGLSNPFLAMRYHSLVIPRVPPGFRLEAWTDDGVIMALTHDALGLYGVQFHPESFLTDEGDLLMRSFLHGSH